MRQYLVCIINRNCLESGPAFRLLAAHLIELDADIAAQYKDYPHLVVTVVCDAAAAQQRWAITFGPPHHAP